MPVSAIHHIGDSISKLGVQTAIEAWLAANCPNVKYLGDDTNNAGIITNWTGTAWKMAFEQDAQILLCNTGMHDRIHTLTGYENRLEGFFLVYKSIHPLTRVIWASTTHVSSGEPDYVAQNALIDSFNAAAITILDSVYGQGNWDYVDQRQLQIDEGIPFSDTVHPTEDGYVLYANNWISQLSSTISNYTAPNIAAVPKVAYSCCKNCPADFKDGETLTVDLVDGVATFSVAQTSAYMGVGAEISYNDGTARKVYVAPSGKISTSHWRVTTATGATPPNCTGASVTVITHVFDELDDAINGHVGSDYLNSTDRTVSGASVELHLACYINQDTYDTDNGNGVLGARFNNSTGDWQHRCFIYAPTDTDTECNVPHGITSSVYDPTRYTLRTLSTVFVKSGLQCFVDLSRVQLFMNNASTSAARTIIGMSCDSDVFWDVFAVHRCILLTETAESGSQAYRGLYLGVTGAGTLLFYNNIMMARSADGINTAAAINLASGGFGCYLYSNTIIGDWTKPIARNLGYAVSRNNVFTGMSSASDTDHVDMDFDVYDVEESEENGRLTTQSDAELFTDVADADMFAWDLTPNVGSDALLAGTPLSSEYSGDLLHYPSWRRTLRWDAGAIQLSIPTANRPQTRTAIHCGIGTF